MSRREGVAIAFIKNKNGSSERAFVPGFRTDLLKRLVSPKRLERLVTVRLNRCKVDDEDLQRLSALSYLRYLDLHHTQVTDVGIGHIRKLKHLNHLGLSGTRISDKGLTYLAELPNLYTIDLDGTNVTYDGIKRLKQAAPNTCDLRHRRAVAELRALRHVVWGSGTRPDDPAKILVQRRPLDQPSVPHIANYNRPFVHLHLNDECLNSRVVSMICGLPAKQFWQLGQIEYRNLKVLHEAGKIHELIVYRSKCTTNVINELAAIESLDRVVFSNCQVDGSELSKLQSTRIRCLDLQTSVVTDLDPSRLPSTLTQLTLGKFTPVNKDVARQLAALFNLQSLALSGQCPIPDSALVSAFTNRRSTAQVDRYRIRVIRLYPPRTDQTP